MGTDGTGQETREEERTKGEDKQKTEPESTEGVGTSEQVGESVSGGRVKKDKADRKKAKTRTWFDVVKGLKTEDELETTNSDKSRNESEEADSVQ